jgi:hypothetical protein
MILPVAVKGLQHIVKASESLSEGLLFEYHLTWCFVTFFFVSPKEYYSHSFLFIIYCYSAIPHQCSYMPTVDDKWSWKTNNTFVILNFATLLLNNPLLFTSTVHNPSTGGTKIPPDYRKRRVTGKSRNKFIKLYSTTPRFRIYYH